jgi:NitT/TauT family transport system substrate-binding protein
MNFGVMAAQALEDRKVDGFWANGMGAELAVRRGVGSVVIDVRRGDGPQACFNFTMPVIVTSDRLIEREPEAAASAIKAVVTTQTALKRDVSLATQVSANCFRSRKRI